MKYCKYCGQPIPDYGIYCSNCGARQDNTVNNNQYPYSQPMNQQRINVTIEEDTGSKVLGFLLGFLLGIIGLIIAACLRQTRTTKGAVVGFITGIIIFIILPILLVACLSSQYYLPY